MGVLGTSANVTAMAALAGSSSVEIPALTVKAGDGADGNFFLIADNSDDNGDDWLIAAKHDPLKTLQITNNFGTSGGVMLTLTNSTNLTSESTADFAGTVGVGNSVKFENSVNGSYTGSVSVKSAATSSSARTITLPDLDGTVALTSQLSGVTAGLVTDLSPQLGGNLDVNGKDIVSTSNGAIELDPNGSGKVTFKGNATKGAGQFVLNCEQNSHGITIKGPPHSAAASYTLTLPNDDGSAGQSLISDGSGTLSFSTITTNATHTGEVTGSGALTIADNIVDEANLKVSNSPVNGYVLTAQSGASGGLTWAADSTTDSTKLPLAGGTMTGALKTLTLQETHVNITTNTELNLATGTSFFATPNGNKTYTFANPPSSGTAFGFTLKITPSATSALTWPSSVDWAGGSAPAAPASGATNVYSFYTSDGGTTYYGFLAGAALA